MNIARMKALLWVVALALGAGLSLYVYEFFESKPELEKGVTREEQLRILEPIEAPQPPKDSVVAYDDVNLVFHGMNWTGELPPPPPTVEPGQNGPEEQPKTPVSELLSILFLQVDLSDPAGSLAYVRFLDAALVAKANDSEDYLLRVGKKLAKPHAYVEVQEITTEGVRFSFEGDSDRDSELVALAQTSFEGPRIVQVGRDGSVAVAPRRSGNLVRVANAPAFRPKETTQVGENRWLLGVDTMARVEQNYSSILSRDLRYRAKRGADGRIKGIEVTHVAAGSLPEQHGVTPGEILKSINGHAVTGVNDAIAYVKRESDQTDTWVAVFEKYGKEYTRVYTTPPE